MADIFISYSNEDRPRIARLADALERAGQSIFWDRQIPAGLTWRSYIGKALTDSKCVVVAWSAVSVESEWVLEEAELAKKAKLIPVSLENVSPPLGFGGFQASDLSTWDGDHRAPEFKRLLENMKRLLGDARDRGAETATAVEQANVPEDTEAEGAPAGRPAQRQRQQRQQRQQRRCSHRRQLR
jgi:TIR domain